jgi:hypothetical protein
MKKLLVILCFATTAVQAQTQEQPMDSNALGAMTKVQLAKLYIEEVQRATKQMALFAFDTVANDVPTTKYTAAKFKKVDDKVQKYNQTLMEQFLEIIPYADKAEIIASILYLKQF